MSGAKRPALDSSSRDEHTTPSRDQEDPRVLICELCALFYTKGWVTGTGGGISVRQGDTIYVAPSGVQKERLRPEDMFRLDREAAVIGKPSDPSLTLSQCTPLFMLAYKMRGAGAVMHSHSKHAVLATLITDGDLFTVSHLEMIKGVRHGVTGAALRYDDTLAIPIIDNTAFECDLEDSMRKAMEAHPACTAVLVRRHGVYVWGDSWQRAKATAECLDWLFETVVDMRRLSLH